MVLSTENDLLLRSKRGDTEAYGQLVKLYQKSVFNVCYRMLNERRDAEDLTQESFVRAYQRLETFDLTRPFGPWIRRLATNQCLNYLQRKFFVYEELEEERQLPSADRGKNPETEQVQREQAESIRGAISRLSPQFRAVIEMRHFQDMSYAEISEALGMPLSDVKSNLYRGRRQLAREMKDE